MSRLAAQDRRGLTLLELMLALAITAIVAVAAAGMLRVGTIGISHPRDSRTAIVSASVAQSRLAAYITPARSILDVNGSHLVLWLDDSRQGGNVHASEIRWILFESGMLNVHYVQLPTGGTQVARELADLEYLDPASTDWMAVRQYYADAGLISTLVLVDGLASVDVSTDGDGQVTYRLDLVTRSGIAPVEVTATIRELSEP